MDKEVTMEVMIEGIKVPIQDLRADIRAAKEKGLSHCFAFTPETVEALLNLIDNLNKGV